VVLFALKTNTTAQEKLQKYFLKLYHVLRCPGRICPVKIVLSTLQGLAGAESVHQETRKQSSCIILELCRAMRPRLHNDANEWFAGSSRGMKTGWRDCWWPMGRMLVMISCTLLEQMVPCFYGSWMQSRTVIYSLSG
jgi:hypothetical protein